MEITANSSVVEQNLQTQKAKKENNSLGIKNLYTQKLSVDETKELKRVALENANAFSFSSVSLQQNITSKSDSVAKNIEDFQAFLKDIGYEGQSIATLSQEQAKKLVAEDGIFGIKQTSSRISDFVLNGANGNEELLRAGRQGVLEGFKQAEGMWGSKLPDISYKTIDQAIQNIDMAMNDLGFNILNQEA